MRVMCVPACACPRGTNAPTLPPNSMSELFYTHIIIIPPLYCDRDPIRDFYKLLIFAPTPRSIDNIGIYYYINFSQLYGNKRTRTKLTKRYYITCLSIKSKNCTQYQFLTKSISL